MAKSSLLLFWITSMFGVCIAVWPPVNTRDTTYFEIAGYYEYNWTIHNFSKIFRDLQEGDNFIETRSFTATKVPMATWSLKATGKSSLGIDYFYVSLTKQYSSVPAVWAACDIAFFAKNGSVIHRGILKGWYTYEKKTNSYRSHILKDITYRIQPEDTLILKFNITVGSAISSPIIMM